MALNVAVANDIANAVLTFYARGKTLAQTMQDRPTLGWLRGGMKSFPGGKDYISEPVRGGYMSDTAGFLQGITEADELTFAQSANILRCQVPWKQVSAGLLITWTELLKTGITVTDSAKTSQHAQSELIVLTNLLEERMDDFGESYARTMNTMLWGDGSQDAKQVPGLTSIFGDDNANGITEGLDKATYTWWRHRVALGIGVSETDQTLSKKLRKELIQLRRYGGRPNKAFCGSDFLDALFIEVQAKGFYTDSGFTQNNDMGMDTVQMKGLGQFTYDPTLDDMGFSKRCYVFDSRRVKLRPIEGEDNKINLPDRPYNYLVFLKNMTWAGGLICTQMNANAIYSIAEGKENTDMKKLLLTGAVAVFTFVASAADHRVGSFLNATTIQVTNAIPVTSLLGTFSTVVRTNIAGVAYTSLSGVATVVTNSVSAAASQNLLGKVDLWAADKTIYPVYDANSTNSLVQAGPYTREIFIRLVGESGANSAVTFVFYLVPDGVNEMTASSISIAVTATTTTEVRSLTKLNEQTLVGVKSLLLKSVTNADTDASSGVTVKEVSLVGWTP